MTLLVTLVWLFGLAGLGTASLADVCPQGERPVYEVVDLVPEIPDQPSRKQTNFTFFSRRLTVHYHEGQLALLSSTPDGTEKPSTDDVFWVRAQPSARVWTHDFRDPSRTKIVPIEPQWVTHLFVPGPNELEVVIQDRTPPVYSSRPWYLLLISCVPQPGTYAPTPTPQPTATPTASPTASPSATPTATSTPTPSPTFLPTATATATPTPTPQDSVAFLPLVQVSAPVEDFPVPSPGGPRTYPWLVVGSVVGTGMALWRLQSRRRRQWVEGMVRISKGDKHVRTVHLVEFHKNPVTIGPHDDIPLEIDPALAITRVQLRKQQGADGHSEVVAEYLAAADPATDGKRTNRTMRVVQTQKLRHGDAFFIGPYRLVYQHYA